MEDFNPRSREGSDRCSEGRKPGNVDFNPRSREGSDGLPVQYILKQTVISILAPARGATGHADIKNATNEISILAPARGATQSNDREKQSEDNFNPRSREGSDEDHRAAGGQYSTFQSSLPRGERLREIRGRKPEHRISILAPARGATSTRRSQQSAASYFNPRSREGSDEVKRRKCSR